MKKLLVRYVLSLCILLPGGYGQLAAHGYQASGHNTSSELSECFDPDGIVLIGNSASLVKRYATPVRDKVLFIDAVEGKDEDDDLSSSPNDHRYFNDDFAAVFCALTRGYFLSCVQDILPFLSCISDISPFRRHLILQVFRI
jgi:hypothetical protein